MNEYMPCMRTLTKEEKERLDKPWRIRFEDAQNIEKPTLYSELPYPYIDKEKNNEND